MPKAKTKVAPEVAPKATAKTARRPNKKTGSLADPSWTSQIAASNKRLFKSVARERQARRAPVPDVPLVRQTPSGYQPPAPLVLTPLKNKKLGDVRLRRVLVEITRESDRGSFTRGDKFLIVGKELDGWTLQAAGPDGKPQGRRYTRVQASSLSLIEEVLDEPRNSGLDGADGQGGLDPLDPR